MKRTFKLISLCAITFALLLSGCKKENIADPELKPDEPTTDLVRVTSDVPAFIMAGNSTELLDMLRKRFVNIQGSLNSNKVSTVVIDKTSAQNMTSEQWKQLAKIYYDGGVIVYVQPTLQDFADLSVHAYSAILQLGYEPDMVWEQLEWLGYYNHILEANPNLVSMKYEAIAINNEDSYFLTDFGTTLPVEYAFEVVNQETGVTDSISYQHGTTGEMTIYRKGLLVDDLVQWITNANEAQMCDKGEAKVAKEITLNVPVTFYPSKFTSLGWGWSVTVPCKIIYTIWSVYDLNQHKDNYVFCRNIEFDGSYLECGPDNPEKWWVDKNKNPDYYGPYLNSIQVESSLVGSSPSLTNWKPQNPMTSTTYSEGLSYGLSGAINVSEKPGLNIGGSLSISKSVSTSVPDLKMEVWHNDPNPKYQYHINKRPQGHFVGSKHDIVAGNLRQDISMQQYWTWIVNSYDYADYSFNTNFEVVVEFLRCTDGFFKYNDYYQSAKISYNGLNVTLPAPPRAIQEWRMFCVTSDQNLINFVSEAYDGYFYNKLFQVPAATSTDKGAIDQFIHNFEERLNCDRDLWRARGFTGDFEFVWRPSTSSEIYHTTHFHVNQ